MCSEAPMTFKPLKIVFHIRPWEVGLHTALEKLFSENFPGAFEYIYMTHHFEAEYLLRQKGKDCLNITQEMKRIPFPPDWRDRLQSMENRCSGQTRNFMQYLIAERFFKNKPRPYQWQKLYKMAVFYDSFFEKNKPFFMLSNGPDHLAFWLAMDLMRGHGGHPCGLVGVSWPRGHFSRHIGVGEIYYGPQLYREYLERGLTPGERRYVEELQTAFIQGKSVPINISQERFSLIRKRDFKTKVKDRLKSMYWGVVERVRRNWYVQPYAYPWNFLVNALRWRYAAYKTQTYFNEDLPQGVPFIFFPLHLEPEATTQLYANYYENQLETITFLAKSLPVSWVLAVKEHPNMQEARPRSFYRGLRRLPNVVLISRDIPSWRLVQECRLVATLSGSSGLEAAIIGKPALFFGDPPWGYSPTALKVKSIHELSRTLQEAGQLALPRDDERVQAFILSWVKANPQGIYEQFPWLPPVDDPANVILIGSALMELMKDLQNGHQA